MPTNSEYDEYLRNQFGVLNDLQNNNWQHLNRLILTIASAGLGVSVAVVKFEEDGIVFPHLRNGLLTSWILFASAITANFGSILLRQWILFGYSSVIGNCLEGQDLGRPDVALHPKLSSLLVLLVLLSVFLLLGAIWASVFALSENLNRVVFDCELDLALEHAMQAFLDGLDKQTLSDLFEHKADFRKFLALRS